MIFDVLALKMNFNGIIVVLMMTVSAIIFGVSAKMIAKRVSIIPLMIENHVITPNVF